MSTLGYLEVLARWREQGKKYGNPPPAVPNSDGTYLTFNLAEKWKLAKGDPKKWDAHVKTMQENFDETYLEETFPTDEYAKVNFPSIVEAETVPKLSEIDTMFLSKIEALELQMKTILQELESLNAKL